jgi:ERCC4-type nuclease
MKRRATTLIKSPLDWQMASAPVPHSAFPVLAERGGTQLRTPRCTVVVDTREQNPFDFTRFEGWFASVEHRALKLGDYSIAGLEDICVIERKDLTDLVHSCTATRSVFIDRLKRMSSYPHRLLVVTAALSQVKSPYPQGAANPNRIFQSLIALLAGWSVPFLCTETHALGEEAVASYLYQVHLYHWLETNDYGRFLADLDL